MKPITIEHNKGGRPRKSYKKLYEGEEKLKDLTPRQRLEWYQSELKKRDLQERDRELIRSSELERTIANAFKTLSASLESLSDTLERQLGLVDSQNEKIREVVNNMRLQLYLDLTGKDPEESNDSNDSDDPEDSEDSEEGEEYEIS